MDNSQIIKTQEFFESFREALKERFPNRLKITDDLRADNYSKKSSKELVDIINEKKEDAFIEWTMSIMSLDRNLNKVRTDIKIRLREGEFVVENVPTSSQNKALTPRIRVDEQTSVFMDVLFLNILRDSIPFGR